MTPKYNAASGIIAGELLILISMIVLETTSHQVERTVRRTAIVNPH
jgi:hypothetical protein